MTHEVSRNLREEKQTPRAKGIQKTWALEDGRWRLPVSQIGVGALGVAAERGREKTGEEKRGDERKGEERRESPRLASSDP